MKFYVMILALLALTVMVFAVDNATGNNTGNDTTNVTVTPTVTPTPSPSVTPNVTVTPSITPNNTGNFTCAPAKFMIPKGDRAITYEAYCLTNRGGLVRDPNNNEWCCGAVFITFNNTKNESEREKHNFTENFTNFTCSPYKFAIPQKPDLKQKYETACTNQNGTIKYRTLPNNNSQEWCCNAVRKGESKGKKEDNQLNQGDLQSRIRELESKLRELQKRLMICELGPKNRRNFENSRRDFNSSNQTGTNDSGISGQDLPGKQSEVRQNRKDSENQSSGSGDQGQDSDKSSKSSGRH